MKWEETTVWGNSGLGVHLSSARVGRNDNGGVPQIDDLWFATAKYESLLSSQSPFVENLH